MIKKGRIIIRVLSVVLVLLILSIISLSIIIHSDASFIVNRIIEMKKGDDSPWEFSFDSIAEKKGKTVFKGFSLSYDGVNLCYIEEGSVDLTLSGLYSFWKNEESYVYGWISGGNVDLTSILSSYDDYQKNERSGSFSFYDFLTARNISLSADDINVEYDYFSSTLENIELEYTAEDEVFSGSFSAPLIDSTFQGYTFKAESGEFSFIRESGITVSAILESIRIVGEDVECSLNSVELSEETASLSAFLKNDYTGTLRLSSAEITTYGITTVFTDGSFSYSDNLLSGSFEKAVSDSPEDGTSTGRVTFSFSTENSYVLSCESINAVYGGRNFLISNASIEGRLVESGAVFNIERVESDLSSDTDGKLGCVVVSSLSGTIDFSEGFNLDFTGDVVIETESDSFDDITFSFSSDITTGRDGGTSLAFEIDSLYPGFGNTISSPVKIKADEKGISAVVESETISADIFYDFATKEITGSIETANLALKTLLEFLFEREFEKLSGKSEINMTSDFDFSIEEGVLSGTASFDIEISSYRISFFTFVVRINGSARAGDGRIVLDGVRFTSPVLSFGVEGYYDYVTKEPHFSFTK